MFDIHTMLNLYFIAGSQDCRHLSGTPQQNLLSTLECALQNGITCFQFREKGQYALQIATHIHHLAAACRDLCRQYNVPFFINDNIQLALKLAADGVHIGQEDTPLAEAVSLCKGKLMLGLSNHTRAELHANRHNTAIDYFAIGPIFPTISKPDAKNSVGIRLIRQIRADGFKRPLVAIGGITADNALSVRRAGADGIAVISAITQAEDIKTAINALLMQQN